jgi:thiamine biosynthesis lipoprotein
MWVWRLVVSGLGTAMLVGCAGSNTAPHLLSRAHPTMGSEVRVSVWTLDDGAAAPAIDAVFAEFDRLDAMLSVWKSGSDILKINAAAGQAPVTVSAETCEVLALARQISEWTDGKFDVTFGALSDVWKFDHDRDNRVPDAAAISARLPLIDYRALAVDAAARTVFASRAGMRVHVGGIGKGYAVDRAVAILRGRGLHDFMVQAGGDLYVAGQPGDGPWRLGINDPRGAPTDSFATVELRDATFSTSGDYERSFIQNGQRYHHILDPDTGQPARGAVSVTIVAASAGLADGLSTGVFIMGPEAGLALVERLPDVDAVIVTADNRVLVSSGLEGRVHQLRPPTATRP